MNASTLCCAAALTALALTGCKSHGEATKDAPAAKVKPAQVQAIAKAPTPPPDAKQANSIGVGEVMIRTANDDDEMDPTWVQKVDIDGDGDLDTTTILWDDEDKMLFAYAESEVTCAYGGVATAKVLVGVNANGNTRGKPAGSGFYAVYLDATECGAEAAGLFGARFDPDGLVTEAGAILIDEETDQVVIVAAEG